MRVKQFCRFLVAIMATLGLLMMFPFYTYATDAGQFDLDVILVIDNSESMLSADPDGLALSASNLFIDMCEDSDSRVGYVMYTHTIPSFQPLTYISSFSAELKKSIASTHYQKGGHTDTALGLEKALELFKQDALDGKSNRKPVIILLSDGNTDLPGPGGRTTNQSLAALDVVKGKLAEAGIPVYTIGFNHDGSLDVEAMEDIADATGAAAQKAKTAGELQPILRRIYSELTGAKSISFPAIQATGKPQQVVVSIDNDSTYKATITIMSKKPVDGISLKSPGGKDIYTDADRSGKLTINKDPGGRYTLLSLYHPEKGDWILMFTGTKNDVVTIDLISVYDLKLVMNTPVATFSKTDISWHLEDPAGQKITDDALIAGLVVTFHANDDTVIEQFPKGQTEASFALKAGDYRAYLSMESEDIVRTSNVVIFTVPAGNPITLKNSAVDTINVGLVTSFKKNKTLHMNQLINYTDYNRELDVNFTGGEWEDFIRLDYDASSEAVLVSSLKSGKSETKVTITGSDGSKVTFFIIARIIKGWLFLIGVLIALLIAAGLVALIIHIRKPYLDTPMRDFQIEVNLPVNEIGNQPSATTFRLEHRKGKRSLQQVIDYNHAGDYDLAFQNIKWFATGMTLIARNANTIEVSTPVSSRFEVAVNGRKIIKPTTSRLSRNLSIVVRLYSGEDSMYEIILGNQTAGMDFNNFDDFFSLESLDSPGRVDTDPGDPFDF